MNIIKTQTYNYTTSDGTFGIDPISAVSLQLQMEVLCGAFARGAHAPL